MKIPVDPSSAPARVAPCPPARREGIALLTVVLLLGLLGLLLAAFWPVSKAEMLGAFEHARERTAFFTAEEGVRYYLTKLNADLRSGALQMVTNSVQTVNYSPPSGSQFDGLPNVKILHNGWVIYSVTGHCQQASAVIEATLRQPNLLGVGVFGDINIELQPGAGVYSYDSRINLNPTAATSTGMADVGLNDNVKVQPGFTLDGQFVLGTSPPPDLIPADPSQINTNSYSITQSERIEPDPLGAAPGGSLYTAFEYYKVSGNNSNGAVSGISNNKLTISNSETVTLNGGRYYLTELTIATKGALVINSTPQNPVVIFMDGRLDAQPKQGINNGAGKSPLGLYILSRSTAEINMQPAGEFRGLIYAPYANVNFQPRGDVYGVVWGKTIDKFHPGGNIFVDTGLINSMKAKALLLTQWRQML